MTAAVLMYTSSTCLFCSKAKALLERKGVTVEEVRIDRDPVRMDEMLARSGGCRTVPQIFIGDTHVGGCDDLYALDRAGELDVLLGHPH